VFFVLVGGFLPGRRPGRKLPPAGGLI